MSGNGASYRAAGVDYEVLDAGKRLAMTSALATSTLMAARGGRALDASRGEPAFVFELGGQTLAFVVEGLGTKSMIARAVLEEQGINRFAEVAYDTVAAIVNDLCCVGALPIVVNAYFATGSSAWYSHEERSRALVEGWQRACVDAGCAWGGGESPSLPGLLAEEEIELAGAAVGAVPEGCSPILGDALRAGDEIVLVASSGLHANGASLARLIAGRLPAGYATELSDGTRLRRGSAGAVDRLRAVGGRSTRAGSADQLPEPCDRSRDAQADAPAKGTDLPDRATPAGPAGPLLPGRAGRAGPGSGLLHFQHGNGLRHLLRGRIGGGGGEHGSGSWIQAILAGGVEEGPRRVLLEPVGVSLAGDRVGADPRSITLK